MPTTMGLVVAPPAIVPPTIKQDDDKFIITDLVSWTSFGSIKQPKLLMTVFV